IRFEFNEFVQLNDIHNQLIVSPPLKQRPIIRIKKKGVIIQLQEKLLPNTTYTFNFGNGIGDLTENNPVKDLVYVVSTGDVLDSLLVKGAVKDAYTNELVKGAKVMLYRSMEDSMPKKQKPFYFGLTNESGEFSIQNMADGDYQIVVLEEQNGNYVYDDLANEKIGFKETAVKPDNPGDSLAMSLHFNIAKANDTIQYLQDFKTDSTGFIKALYFQKPALPQLEWIGKSTDFSACPDPNSDTTFLWLNGKPSNSFEKVVISDGTAKYDTLELKFYDTPTRFLKVVNEAKESQRTGDTLHWLFDRPMSEIDMEKIKVVKDSVEQEWEFSVAGFEVFAFAMDAKPEETYQISALPGAFLSREGYKNDSITQKIKFLKEDHFGSLELNLDWSESGSWLLQLIDSKGDVISSDYVGERTVFSYSRMFPDSYKLRLIHDENQNG
ncbi:MAG: Ig-like domain-containing protein, partial [Flavobacteriales bacterium]